MLVKRIGNSGLSMHSNLEMQHDHVRLRIHEARVRIADVMDLGERRHTRSNELLPSHISNVPRPPIRTNLKEVARSGPHTGRIVPTSMEGVVHTEAGSIGKERVVHVQHVDHSPLRVGRHHILIHIGKENEVTHETITSIARLQRRRLLV